MLYILGIVLGFICIIKSVSKGLRQGTQRLGKGSHCTQEKKKKNFSEQELYFIIKLVSIGMVDSDPDMHHHIKEYRDLRGSAY